MRLTATVVAITLLAVAPASGQVSTPEQYPYGLDPYKPSDAALLRLYGATLVAQTPLSELRKLDPYKPSHAALLRQLGGAIPLWGWWYPYPTAPVFAPLTPFPTAGPTGGVNPTANLSDVVAPPNNRLSSPRLMPERLREPDRPSLPEPGIPRAGPQVQAKASVE